MRIVSLLPSSTEIAYALGLGDQVVGVTHECDYPAPVHGTPVVTRSALDHTQTSSAEIDEVVSSQLRDELSIYQLDTELLAQLQPDLILTQALCDVCAVSFPTVQRAVRDLGGSPHILSLEPETLEGIFATIGAVGTATGHTTEAARLLDTLRARVDHVRSRSAQAPYRPRVACLEWLDPPFGPGHWLPELVQLAGGQPGLGQAGQRARRITWNDVIAFAPEVIIVSACGFDLPRTVAEAEAILPTRSGWTALPAVRANRVYAIDGNAYCSRPGPRIVDSLELLASLIHPDLFAGWGPNDAAQRICAADKWNLEMEQEYYAS